MSLVRPSISLLPRRMPIHSGLHPTIRQHLCRMRADDVFPESRLLQQLEMPQRRARVRQVFEVGRSRPVLQIGQVCDEGRLGQVLLRGEVVEVGRVGERLHELELDLEAREAAVFGFLVGFGGGAFVECRDRRRRAHHDILRGAGCHRWRRVMFSRVGGCLGDTVFVGDVGVTLKEWWW